MPSFICRTFSTYLPLSGLPFFHRSLLPSFLPQVRHENTLFLLFQIYFAQKEDWQGDTPEEREKSRRSAVEEVRKEVRREGGRLPWRGHKGRRRIDFP
jgi:hypothetical protein